ncbi:hypothetical protein FACS189430_10950 [Bacteroidia bacterium]|nr:hypothetical protein FACS189430_10950 [Bacteroidia bacterium]
MLQHLKPLFKNSAIYALGGISSKIVGFVLLPFYVDKLSAAEYGMLGTLEVTAQLLIAVGSLNLFVAFARWYADKELQGKQESVFFTWLVTIITVAVLLSVSVGMSASVLSRLLLDSDSSVRLLRLMAYSTGLELIGTVPATLCRMQSASGLFTRNLIIRLGTVLPLTILLIVVFDRKVEGIYEAQIMGGIIYLVFFTPYIRKNIKIHFEKQILVRMFHFSLPFILSSSFAVLLNIADRYSLKFIIGLASVGIYSLGFKLGNSLKLLIIQPVSLALPPLMFQMMDKPNAKRFYAKLMTYLTFGIMFFVLAVSLFGQEAVKLLTAADPEYWNAYTIIPFIAFGLVFGMMKDQASYSLQIVKRTKIIASVIIAVSLLNIALNILLIPLVGTLGAALATLLSQILYFVIMLHYAQKYYPVRYELKKVFLSIGLGAAFCLLAWLIRDCPLTWRLIIKTILLLSYPAVLYLFRFYDKAELQALRGFWKKWKNPQAWKGNITTKKF